MGSRAGQLRKAVVDLLEGRPGWRLEPRTTPGAPPLWCFVAEGKVACSVTVADGSIRLYVMDTDEELEFADVGELTAWIRLHRADALGEAPPRPGARERMRRLFEWS